MRAALLALAFHCAAGWASSCTVAPEFGRDFPNSVQTQADITVSYEHPTTRYRHGVLGDAIEAGALFLYTNQNSPACGWTLALPQELVFEDLTPRLHDLDGDQIPEVITIRSHRDLGAQIAIYKLNAKQTELRLQTTTPYIGRPNRWLAPVGVADFNGDGLQDIAYIDRPHLAKTMQIWSYKNGKLQHLTNVSGLTNHKIGDDFISGGVRNCGPQPQAITADADWRNIIATSIEGKVIKKQKLGRYTGRNSLKNALNC